jgi:hypothetical protein
MEMEKWWQMRSWRARIENHDYCGRVQDSSAVIPLALKGAADRGCWELSADVRVIGEVFFDSRLGVFRLVRYRVPQRMSYICPCNGTLAHRTFCF